MRKGDEKKQQILRVSEQLFLRKGFEATGIQDILDILHTSKGGFYHHFESKDAVLSILCSQHAQKAAERAKIALNKSESKTIERLNLVCRYFMPIQQEQVQFLKMLIPTLSKKQSISVRVNYQETLQEAFHNILKQELDLLAGDGVIYPRINHPENMILMVLNRCWYKIAMYLLECMQKNSTSDPAQLANALENAQRAVEVLLEAPWGSIQFMDLQEIVRIADVLISN